MRYLISGMIVIAVTVIGLGCASQGVNKGQFNIVSLQDEWELGAQLEKDLDGQLRIIHDREAEAYINSIGQQIVAQTEMKELPWKFHLVSEQQVNAFNIPGGHVYVYAGLIQESSELSELVGVMAHEISHGVSRHGTEQLSKQYGIAIVASLVLGQNPAIYQQIVASIVANGAMARFSRDAEREADRLGVHYMYEAGYDPEGMVSMFRNLLEVRQRKPSSLEQFFSSHPLTEDRIQYTRQEVSKLQRRDDLVMNTTAYRTFRNRIVSLAQGTP